jgi:protease II
MSLKTFFKKRNWTRKSWTSFRDNFNQYLTPEECAALRLPNDLVKFQPVNINMTSKVKSLLKENRVSVSKSMIQKISREIRKEWNPHVFMFKEDPLIRGSTHKDSGYPVLKEEDCKKSVVLDLHALSKRFPYLHVATKELNSAGDKWLLAIDFIGSQCFQLFTKSIYADDYQEIKLPKKHMLQTHQLLSDSRYSSEQATWFDNTRILYVSINRYYNESGVYLYDLETKTHKLLYKSGKGVFIEIDSVSSGLFMTITTSDYNSDEIHLLDLDTLKVSLLLPRKFSVCYPYLNHEKGEWIVGKRDKGIDLLATTPDFKKWTILYQNKSPYEQILNVKYYRGCFVFTLETLKGLCLYTLKCGKLVLIERSFDYYKLKDFFQDKFMVHKYKYTCPYEPMAISLETMKVTIEPMVPKYHEVEVFIRPHLRVTLIYKTKKKNMPCLLRGYGAYNTYEHASESPYYYPLLERGFVIAIAHLRGGGEYGYKGYNDGRMDHKKNTFQDFIDTAHFLCESWTSRDKLAIWGRSCGGLMISSVLNQEPDLCKVALAGVPFITPIETMRTYKTPLGFETKSELGDTTKKKIEQYVHSYAPLEHLKKEGEYPNLLIYTNLNDTLVPYTEPLAYYKALKEIEVYASGKSDLSFYLDIRFGHHQGTLLKDKCDHYGMLFGYILKHLNV